MLYCKNKIPQPLSVSVSLLLPGNAIHRTFPQRRHTSEVCRGTPLPAPSLPAQPCATNMNAGSFPIDTMDAADVAIAECGHRFCTACILQWLDVGHQHCPMCKASISHLRVLRQLDGTRVAEPITEPVVLLLRARWRERPTVLPPDDVQPERSAVGDWDHDYGFDEEADVLLRVRASSRVNAEHRALVRAAGGGGARPDRGRG